MRGNDEQQGAVFSYVSAEQRIATDHPPGMLHTLPNLPAVARTLDQISDVLHADVRDLDSEESLSSDVSVQLALFAASVSTALAVMEQGIKPAAVSGLSVGAFAAAVTAGVLTLRDGVRTVFAGSIQQESSKS